MSNGIIVFQKMIVLLTMMMVGFFSYKKRLLNKETCKHLSKLVVNILNPLLLIDGVIGKESGGNVSLVWLNILMVVIYFLVLFVLGFPVVKLLGITKKETALYRVMLMFSNVGFMGIPVITGLYGSDSTVYIVFYMIGYNIMLYTYGIHLVRKGNGEGEQTGGVSLKDTLKKIVNPGVIACVVAIIIFAFHPPVPGPVADIITGLGQPAVPLSMILIGASMAEQNFKEIITGKRMYAFLSLRLLSIPILAALVVSALHLDRQVMGVFGLMLAMPVGSIVVLIATDQGADEKLCTRGCVLSTLFSVLTIPVVAMFLP